MRAPGVRTPLPAYPFATSPHAAQHNDAGCLYLFGSLAFGAALVTLLLPDKTRVPLSDYDEGDDTENIK